MTIYSIIFDWKRTVYNPETRTLIHGAITLLDYFSQHKIPLYLIGKGKEEMYAETARLDVAKYFTEILFVEGSKDPNDFLKFMDKNNPEQTIVIGDRILSELAVGKSVGATTIWVRQGKFAVEEPEDESQQPDFVVVKLSEIIASGYSFFTNL
jgi:phosphoglycolate phosphatase-like HAD superfamily hydrolase